MKKKMCRYTCADDGRSMIEMVGVLAIAGLLTAGAFVLITSGMASQKRRRAFDEVQALAQSVQMLTAEGGNFNQLPLATSNERYKDGHKLAQSLLKSSAVTPFGEETYYVVTQADSSHNSSWAGYLGLTGADSVLFTVGVMNLDNDECLLLAQEAYNEAPYPSCISGNVWFYFGK